MKIHLKRGYPMLLYFVRHGDPIYDPDSLTPLGVRQAEAIGHRLASSRIDRVFASSSERARLTAVPTSEMAKRDITILDWCSEQYVWQDLTIVRDGRRTWYFADPDSAALFRSREMRELGSRWREHPFFDGTRVRDGMARVDRETDALLLSLGYRHDRERACYLPVAPTEEHVALFAHEGFGHAFLSSLLDVPYPTMCTSFSYTHSGLTVVEFAVTHTSDGDIVIPRALQLSDTSHLYAEHLPLCYQNRLFY